jgi:hypothetical protein
MLLLLALDKRKRKPKGVGKRYYFLQPHVASIGGGGVRALDATRRDDSIRVHIVLASGTFSVETTKNTLPFLFL